jgi:serine/threonine-protein kinase RsbW
MSRTNSFESLKRVRRSLAELTSLSDFIHHQATTQALGEEVEYGLQLVAEELFTNMVKYGKDGGPDIEVRLSGDARQVTMVFQDPGSRPFDPTETRPRDLEKPVQERRPGGLGVHLVRMYMDEFRYEHREGTGVTTVTKKLRNDRA